MIVRIPNSLPIMPFSFVHALLDTLTDALRNLPKGIAYDIYEAHRNYQNNSAKGNRRCRTYIVIHGQHRLIIESNSDSGVTLYFCAALMRGLISIGVASI